MPVTSTPQTPNNSQRQDQPLSPIFGHSPSVKSHLEGNVCIGDIVVKLVLMFKTATTKPNAAAANHLPAQDFY